MRHHLADSKFTHPPRHEMAFAHVAKTRLSRRQFLSGTAGLTMNGLARVMNGMGAAGVRFEPITMPVEAGVSARVYAGTTCQDGDLWLRTEAVAGDTRLGRLMASVAATPAQAMPSRGS